MTYGVYLFYQIQIWKYQGPNQEFIIRPGEPFSSINHRLSKAEIISSPVVFYRLAKVKKILTKFKVGHFSIHTGMNMTEVIGLLTTGIGKSIKITIQEGKNLYEVAKILEKKDIIKNAKEFVEVAKDREFSKELGLKGHDLEGYLFPDTYLFPPKSSPTFIATKMVENFNRKIKGLDFRKSKLSLHEIIILSSIVEKETGASFERPIIAGVFLIDLKRI